MKGKAKGSKRMKNTYELGSIACSGQDPNGRVLRMLLIARRGDVCRWSVGIDDDRSVVPSTENRANRPSGEVRRVETTHLEAKRMKIRQKTKKDESVCVYVPSLSISRTQHNLCQRSLVSKRDAVLEHENVGRFVSFLSAVSSRQLKMRREGKRRDVEEGLEHQR